MDTGVTAAALSRQVVGIVLADVARAAASVARYCDHSEHCESRMESWVVEAAAACRRAAVTAAQFGGYEIKELYADRLRMIEENHVLNESIASPGEQAARQAQTLRQLQITQVNHDRQFHPDVFGMPRSDQLRHYSFHLAKLAGAVAELNDHPESWSDFASRRLPDLFLFGLKLATVMGSLLPEDRIANTQGTG